MSSMALGVVGVLSVWIERGVDEGLGVVVE